MTPAEVDALADAEFEAFADYMTEDARAQDRAARRARRKR